MTNAVVAVLSAAEFKIGCRLISGLSAHPSYDDWLDSRYGTFMGRSLGGDEAQLVTVSLGPFLEWCDDRGLRPSETALDAFALHSSGRDGFQAVESSAPILLRVAPLIDGKPRSISLSHSAKSASRSIRVDL
jgi:hypothetical protein